MHACVSSYREEHDNHRVRSRMRGPTEVTSLKKPPELNGGLKGNHPRNFENPSKSTHFTRRKRNNRLELTPVVVPCSLSNSGDAALLSNTPKPACQMGLPAGFRGRNQETRLEHTGSQYKHIDITSAGSQQTIHFFPREEPQSANHTDEIGLGKSR